MPSPIALDLLAATHRRAVLAVASGTDPARVQAGWSRLLAWHKQGGRCQFARLASEASEARSARYRAETARALAALLAGTL